MATGRPSKYSAKLVEQICCEIAEGKTLRSICRRKTTPHISTVMRWLSEPSKAAFQEQYTRARAQQAETYFDKIADLADATTTKNYNQRRVQIDALKWAVVKLLPRKYGDKVTKEITGADGGPIKADIDHRVFDFSDKDTVELLALKETLNAARNTARRRSTEGGAGA